MFVCVCVCVCVCACVRACEYVGARALVVAPPQFFLNDLGFVKSCARQRAHSAHFLTIRGRVFRVVLTGFACMCVRVKWSLPTGCFFVVAVVMCECECVCTFVQVRLLLPPSKPLNDLVLGRVSAHTLHTFDDQGVFFREFQQVFRLCVCVKWVSSHVGCVCVRVRACVCACVFV